MANTSFIQSLVKNRPVVQLFLCGYFSCVALGWLVLQLPFCQKKFVSGIDVLFTAASAVSTTGLTTVDIGKTFSFPGQLVLLLLIQLGGIGYMIFSSFLILNLTKKTSKLRSIEPAFLLSSDLSITELAKQIITYTAICEISGLILLVFYFRSEGIDSALWNALFHSVSAFCTAGFSPFSSNLEGYKNHLGINTIISLLSLLGAFGFFLWMGFFKRIMNQKMLIGLATRIMKPFATVAIIIGGFLFLLMTTFPTESSKLQKLTISFFQAISTITTTGFNTVDIRAFPLSLHLLIIILMLLGVSLTGNGKDMRGTSFTTLLKLMANTLRNKETNSLWSRKVLFKRTTLAFSTFAAYFLVLLICALLLSLIEKQPFFLLFFETTSALCTVGLSMGITPELSALGKSIIALFMLIGRIGIFIIGFAASTRAISWDRKRNQELVF
ncbi:MAG: hypothetical protein RLZZ453_105 [Chlamydiota bacterium]|jgi:trk system potassium uptake protein TrkH